MTSFNFVGLSELSQKRAVKEYLKEDPDLVPTRDNIDQLKICLLSDPDIRWDKFGNLLN